MNIETHIHKGGFDAVIDAFEENFADQGEHGAGFAVLQDGEPLLFITAGWADRGRTIPYSADTLVPVFSTTKGIAAIVLAEAVTRLPAGYETPVADIWPEFAANGKEAVTIGQLASHQAGLPGFPEAIDPALWLDPPACAAAIAALPPLWEPATAHGYHPLTWGYLVGEIVQRIRGESLGTLLKTEICEPGGIDFHIGLPAAEHGRVADMLRPKSLASFGEINAARRAAFLNKWSAPDRGGAIWKEIEIPSANGHGTALSTAQCYDILANPAQTYLSDSALEALTEARYPVSPDLVLPMETSFGAGPMRNSHGYFGPNPETVGHCGWGGSMAIADPDRRLTCAYVMNRQSPHLVGDPRAVALVNAVYGSL